MIFIMSIFIEHLFVRSIVKPARFIILQIPKKSVIVLTIFKLHVGCLPHFWGRGMACREERGWPFHKKNRGEIN